MSVLIRQRSSEKGKLTGKPSLTSSTMIATCRTREIQSRWLREQQALSDGSICALMSLKYEATSASSFERAASGRVCLVLLICSSA